MNETDDYDDMGYGDDDAWRGTPDETEEPDAGEKFNMSRRMFAVTPKGELLVAPKGSRLDHPEWLDSLNLGYLDLDAAVMGFVRSGQIYIYGEGYAQLGAAQYKLVRQYFPSLAVLGADMAGFVYSGLRPGEEGTQWEPQVKIGPVGPLAAHALRYPES